MANNTPNNQIKWKNIKFIDTNFYIFSLRGSWIDTRADLVHLKSGTYEFVDILRRRGYVDVVAATICVNPSRKASTYILAGYCNAMPISIGQWRSIARATSAKRRIWVNPQKAARRGALPAGSLPACCAVLNAMQGWPALLLIFYYPRKLNTKSGNILEQWSGLTSTPI